MADERWLIAGLGNPGPEYSGNRHNAGLMVADLLAERMGARFKRDRARAAVAAGRLAGFPGPLAEPLSFMDLSGGPRGSLRRRCQMPPERIAATDREPDAPF